jgi:predicted O-methyltransferase YrrM
LAWRLDSVDNDPIAQGIARRHLGHDPRITFHLDDAAGFLGRSPSSAFDPVYADTWAGKFSDLDVALGLVRVGGIYVVDDLVPQPNWPEGHAPKIPVLINELESRAEFTSVKLAWASGLLLLVRTHAA